MSAGKTGQAEPGYADFEATGVEETANRYDHQGKLLHGPIPNAKATIAEIETVIRFRRSEPTANDLALLRQAGFSASETRRGRVTGFTGPRRSYG